MGPPGNKRAAAPGAPAVRLAAVGKAYRRLLRPPLEVLRDVTLDVGPGEVLGLAGPNGSGKSTLLRLVAGIERPSRGRLEVLGGTPDDAAVRRRTGYLAEESSFPPELSAAGALELLAALQGWPRARRRREVPERLAEVGLAAAAGRRLAEYSRGMLRRFGLAQAFLDEPALVLLDEPTAGLDAEGFGALDRLLAGARERGACVLFASHLDADLGRRCDRLEVLFDGRLVPPPAVEPGQLAVLYARLAAERAP